jgi:hypothetical protein
MLEATRNLEATVAKRTAELAEGVSDLQFISAYRGRIQPFVCAGCPCLPGGG